MLREMNGKALETRNGLMEEMQCRCREKADWGGTQVTWAGLIKQVQDRCEAKRTLKKAQKTPQEPENTHKTHI